MNAHWVRNLLAVLLLGLAIPSTLPINAQPTQLLAAEPCIRYYVNAAAPAGGDGLTWGSAFTELRDALDAIELTILCNSAEVWVAGGRYTPHASDRTQSFELQENVAIYGGFAGTETGVSQRDIAANPTILSGDLAGNDDGQAQNYADNSYHVVYSMGGGPTAILDGFTLRDGYADGPLHHSFGGGVYIYSATPVLRNLHVYGNTAVEGGGLYSMQWLPYVYDSEFEANTAQERGGGMYINQGSVVLRGVRFVENTATLEGGGAYLFDAVALISRSEFTHNNAPSGAALLIQSGNPKITHSAFYEQSSATDSVIMLRESNTVELSQSVLNGNTASALIVLDAAKVQADNVTITHNTVDTDVFVEQASPSQVTLFNSIVWGNTGQSNAWIPAAVIEYSLVEGIAAGGSNLDADPLFVDPDGADGVVGTADDDLRLQQASPARNAGNAALLIEDKTDIDRDTDVYELIPLDFALQPRQIEALDMGAYEVQPSLYRMFVPLVLK